MTKKKQQIAPGHEEPELPGMPEKREVSRSIVHLTLDVEVEVDWLAHDIIVKTRERDQWREARYG